MGLCGGYGIADTQSGHAMSLRECPYAYDAVVVRVNWGNSVVRGKIAVGLIEQEQCTGRQVLSESGDCFGGVPAAAGIVGIG